MVGSVLQELALPVGARGSESHKGTAGAGRSRVWPKPTKQGSGGAGSSSYLEISQPKTELSDLAVLVHEKLGGWPAESTEVR